MENETKGLRQLIGSRLRGARSEMGLSQEGAGHALGMSQVYLSMMEGGRRSIKVEDLYRMARLYGKPIGYFFPVEDGSLPSVTASAVERAILFWADDREHYGERAQYQSLDNLPPDLVLREALEMPLNPRIVEVLPRLILLNAPSFDLMALARDSMRRQVQNKLGFLLEILDRLRSEISQSDLKNKVYQHVIWKAGVMLHQNRLEKDGAFCGPPPAGEQRERLLERLPEYCKDWHIIEFWPLSVFERHLKHKS